MENEKFVVKVKKNYGETSVVSARLPMEIVKELDRTANNTGRTRNELILMCIEFALAKLEVEE
ncbi:MAG TPA: ribbon-helix-helix domain-containing protein [Candidatus Anaerotignum merdipullorum]|nr:ribbon-helix-helix domain-containing protein [Candidatus Anaerotignum merdipullorum]